ncbi:MAG: hypothetical protein CML12_04245 [Puniceicoccaceae bacterium]|nr:hypothetical protein [Puniceicoccaceae bacterium]
MDTDKTRICKTSGSSKRNSTKRNSTKLNSTTGSEIRLEDLLAIKQAEQPDARFWQSFDEQLEERTLRACMRGEPWYKSPMRALSSALGDIDFTVSNLSRLVTAASASAFACGLIAWIGLGLFVDEQTVQNPASENFVTLTELNLDSMASYENANAIPNANATLNANSTLNANAIEIGSGNETGNDYVLVDSKGSASVEEDFAVEIISIKNRAEDYDFAADAIPVVIGDSVDYSDSAVHSDEALNELNARSINSYTQLASFAF